MVWGMADRECRVRRMPDEVLPGTRCRHPIPNADKCGVAPKPRGTRHGVAQPDSGSFSTGVASHLRLSVSSGVRDPPRAIKVARWMKIVAPVRFSRSGSLVRPAEKSPCPGPAADP